MERSRTCSSSTTTSTFGTRRRRIGCGPTSPRVGSIASMTTRKPSARRNTCGMWRGWRLKSPEAFEFLEKSRELGINVQVAHKGPTVWPLDKDAFDIGDVDTAATSFPDMKFVVTHIGLPRLDDFCWVATQDKNIYAGMAVAMAFVHTRPRYFAEMMANLLYWLGPDRILFSADYGLWHPKWVS